MKKRLIIQTILIAAIIAAIILLSCNKKAEPIPKDGENIEFYGKYNHDLVEKTSSKGYEIVVIDSCEYIYTWFGAGNGGGSLTHKGNCKFCKERLKLWKN